MKRNRAFTLIELLVVIAIIAILAAILFPVFAQAKVAAKSTAWLSNFRNVSMGTQIYTTDNDDGMPSVNSGGIGIAGWGYGRPDYIWYEEVYPYIKNWEMTYCPADPFTLNQRHIDPVTEAPLPSTDQNYWYAVASRSNIGLNYDFMSPWIYNRTTRYIGSAPINQGRVGQPSATIMQVDTVWDRTASGAPKGGGNWVAEAPCVKDTANNYLDPVAQYRADGTWYSYGGWSPNTNSWLEFGGAWPWFNKRFRVGYFDGHAGTVALGRLTAGCDVRRAFTGAAYDGDLYLWDLR